MVLVVIRGWDGEAHMTSSRSSCSTTQAVSGSGGERDFLNAIICGSLGEYVRCAKMETLR